MTALTRRDLIRTATVAGAAIAAPAAASAAGATRLVVVDSAVMRSAAFGRLATGAGRIDLATEHPERFASVRARLTGIAAIDGLTRWSDWVGLRAELQGRGWRLVREELVDPQANLARWTMQRRA